MMATNHDSRSGADNDGHNQDGTNHEDQKHNLCNDAVNFSIFSRFRYCDHHGINSVSRRNAEIGSD